MTPGTEAIGHTTAMQRLAAIVGPEHVTADAAHTRHASLNRSVSTNIAFPSTVEQVQQVVNLARESSWKIAAAGNFTKQRMGGSSSAVELIVSLRRMNRVLEYEPGDLTITVEAGARVRDLRETLRARGQMLPLDVCFGADASVGGVLATNSSGPLRLGYGTLRDFVIGVHFVTADGKHAKSGGKVVKNVAGYDIAKVLIGSFGTLAIVTDVSFRVFPIAPASVTFLFAFANAAQALEARDRVINSPFLPQALDLLTPTSAALAGLAPPDYFWLIAAASGSEAVIQRLKHDLPGVVHGARPVATSTIDGHEEALLWSAIQEMTPSLLKTHPDCAVIKASVVFSSISDVISRAKAAADGQSLNFAAAARAGTGIVYSYMWSDAPGNEPAHDRIAAACTTLLREVETLGGRAVIEWCPFEVEQTIDRWTPLPDDFQIMQRLKQQFDPNGLLNPGRLYGRI
jgi:glycolate oxidase FAD binding subunit